MENVFFPKNTLEHGLCCIITKDGKAFPENMIVFLFPRNLILSFCQESKDDISQKSTLKDDIAGIIEKGDIHLRKNCLSSNRKIKNDKKGYFY